MQSQLTEKIDRARRAAAELQSALASLSGDNAVDVVTAEVSVIEAQEIDRIKPRRIFNVKVGATIQQVIHA